MNSKPSRRDADPADMKHDGTEEPGPDASVDELEEHRRKVQAEQEERKRQVQAEQRKRQAEVEAERAERRAKAEAERAERQARAVAEKERNRIIAETDKTERQGPAGGGQPEAAPPQVRPTVAPAAVRRRHWGVLLSFLLFVIIPTAVAAWYLWERAADRYASYVGFSVRTEELGSAVELLGGIAELSGSSSSDTDVLYKFIQSQDLVRRVDAKLDLRAIWAKGNPEVDPIFAYHPPGTIEDLVDYWKRMVRVYSDSGTGLIDLTVLAFTPEDATAIAKEIYAESSAMINELSALAREDAIRYAREELGLAQEQLRDAREAMTRFRNRTQIVDPAADIQSQMGLLSSLQVQLAETLIELDILEQTTRESDPRIAQAERKVSVIEARIAEERKKLGIGSEGQEGEVFAELVGEYERLLVDREFAEQSYTAARATYDVSVAEAQRQSRYLGAHVAPTQAEKSEYPDRGVLLGLTILCLFLAWAIGVLVYYSLKDRR